MEPLFKRGIIWMLVSQETCTQQLQEYAGPAFLGLIHWKAIESSQNNLTYRHYSRRFMCKKLGHGSNYGGRPATLATQTKTDLQIIIDFQQAYFKAFPAHRTWHAYVEEQIRAHGRLVNSNR